MILGLLPIIGTIVAALVFVVVVVFAIAEEINYRRWLKTTPPNYTWFEDTRRYKPDEEHIAHLKKLDTLREELEKERE